MTKNLILNSIHLTLLLSGQILFLLFQFTIAAPSKSTDFLIIENPQAYQILNEYEQPFSSAEKKQIHPFAPLEIISLREVLGDQISKVSKFKYDNRICYIPVNDKFQRIPTTTTWEKTYNRCTTYNDTVTAAQSIRVHVKQLNSGTSFTLSKGTQLKRVFFYKSLWYVTPVGSDVRFGWVQGSDNSFSIIKKQSRVQEEISTTDISEKIKIRLQSANELYTSMFNYFNSKTQQQKSIPEWIMVVDGLNIRCTLKGSSMTAKYLEQSTRYITGDIEHLLLGKPFAARYSDGEIIISPRIKD